MGLFEKKYCDFCGNKIGMLGNRKLEDGNLCKDCASNFIACGIPDALISTPVPVILYLFSFCADSSYSI